MNKKILKRSLAVLLASVGVSVDVNAIDLKKIISIENYVDKEGKVIPTAVPQAKEANWFVSPEELITPSEMIDLLELYKYDIFRVTMNEGKDVRMKTAREAGRRIFKFWMEAINKKRKKEAGEAKKAGKKYEKKLFRRRRMRDLGDEKLDDLGEGGRWSNIGRNLKRELFNSHKIYNSPSNLVKAEIEAARQGVINCTAWSTFINWFLNMSGIPSRKLWLNYHECVCVPLRDEENPDAIRLYRIEIGEMGYSVEDIRFEIEPLTTGWRNWHDTDPWDFMAWYKKEQGWGTSYYPKINNKDDFVSKKAYAINPTMAYLELIEEGIRKKGDKQYPLEAINGYVKGLQLELKKLKQSENDVVDNLRGVCTYNVRYIPKDKTGYKIPINIEHLGKAIEIGQGFRKKRTFTDKSMTNKTTDLITAKFNFAPRDHTSLEIEHVDEIDKYRDGNWRLSITAPRKVVNKQDGMDKLDGLLELKDKSEKKLLKDGIVIGLPEKIKDVSAYWNRPGFNKEAGRQMVKSIKDD